MFTGKTRKLLFTLIMLAHDLPDGNFGNRCCDSIWSGNGGYGPNEGDEPYFTRACEIVFLESQKGRPPCSPVKFSQKKGLLGNPGVLGVPHKGPCKGLNTGGFPHGLLKKGF